MTGMPDRPGRWTEPPILPEVPAPPPDRIVVRGARLVRVYGSSESRDVAGKPRRDGGREAVVLAWARMPDGAWAVLMAWTRYWTDEDPPHGTALAQHGWYRYDEERVKPQKTRRPNYEGAEWHGWHEDSELAQAIRDAAATLPPEMREQATTPAPDPD